MASPISKSPRTQRRSPSPRSPRYKFTIFPPDVYAPVNIEYSPITDKSYRFCSFLKSKFESHFGMRCSLPTQAGTAFIGDFDEFERRFLIDAEYIVIVVTEKSILALKRFYPRLLVFVTVRPEWVNRFILVFVGDVALDPTIDLTVLIHQPITFKESGWEADLETWKALHKLLKVEWTPHKEEEPSPTRRGEVLSIIERTVVETEVQEVRTRRRSSSRNSDAGSSTPGNQSPLPGASRKLLSVSGDEPDLTIISPSVEKPNIVKEMPGGRRHFGGRPEVEATRPVVRQSPPASPASTDRIRPRVVIERADDAVDSPKSSTAQPKEVPVKEDVEIKTIGNMQRSTDTSKSTELVTEGNVDNGEKVIIPKAVAKEDEAQSSGVERMRPTQLSFNKEEIKEEVGAKKTEVAEKPRERKSDKRDSWRFASEVRSRKPKEKSNEAPKETDAVEKEIGATSMASEEVINKSRGRTLRSTPKDSMKDVTSENKPETETPAISKLEKDVPQESIQTSGYSSLNSSMSTRSMGQIQSPSASMKISPVEGSSSTDVSYVTAPETLSLPTPRVVPLSPSGKDLETPEISDMTSLASDNAEKPEVEAFQLPKSAGTDETRGSSSSLGKSVAAIAVAVGRFVWPSTGTNAADNRDRPRKLTLLLVTATALSPVYRDFTMSFFGALSSFLWSPIGKAIESGGVTALPVTEIAADATALVTEVLPLTTLCIISPSLLGRISPTTMISPQNFVFWVAAPPR